MHGKQLGISAALLVLGIGHTAQALDFNTHNYRAGHGPNAGISADVNGDGKPDLVIANACGDPLCETAGVVKVLLGNGDGTFTPHGQYQSAGSAGSASLTLAAGDFNGDGNLDLAVVNTGINELGDVSI